MNDQKIIVPLDGSSLAEKALPFAVALARLNQQKLVLLKLEPEVNPSQEDEKDSPLVEEARGYLEMVKREISQPKLPNYLDFEQIQTQIVAGRSIHELGDVINSLGGSQ